MRIPYFRDIFVLTVLPTGGVYRNESSIVNLDNVRIPWEVSNKNLTASYQIPSPFLSNLSMLKFQFSPGCDTQWPTKERKHKENLLYPMYNGRSTSQFGNGMLSANSYPKWPTLGARIGIFPPFPDLPNSFVNLIGKLLLGLMNRNRGLDITQFIN